MTQDRGQQIEWEWIDTPEALPALWEHVAGEERFALDLEADNFHAYHTQTCLFQLATRSRLVLLDTIALGKEALSGLGVLLADPELEVVMHGADNDLMALSQEFGFQVKGLFDTQVAARFLQLPKTGLGSLLTERFNERVSKKFQRLDWRIRPLPPAALTYAAMDVLHLLELQDQLEDELEASGWLEPVWQSCDWAARNPATSTGFNPEGFRKVKRSSELTPAQRAVMRELYLWRHEECSRSNRAHLFVMTDMTMITLARRQPKTRQALSTIRGLAAGLRDRHGATLINAIERGRRAKPLSKAAPRRADEEKRPLTRAQREVFEHLRCWRAGIGARDGIPVDIVAPGKLLHAVIRAEPRTLGDLEAIDLMLAWRFERYGAELFAAFRSA